MGLKLLKVGFFHDFFGASHGKKEHTLLILEHSLFCCSINMVDEAMDVLWVLFFNGLVNRDLLFCDRFWMILVWFKLQESACRDCLGLSCL